MNQNATTRGSVVLKGLAVGLWGITSLMMLLAIQYAADLIVIIYAAFWARGMTYGPDYYGAIFLRQMMVVIMALMAAIVIIGGAEYHLRHFNTPGSWRLFARVLGVTGGIFLLVAMFQ